MDEVRVFEMNRAGDDLEVSLPVAWARAVDAASVVFNWSEVFGWHAHVHARDGWHMLSFPWTDQVDRILRGEGRETLPADGTSWWDLDEGWWGVVERRGDRVFVAETDMDALSDSADTTRVMRAPGDVLVGGVEITWSVIPSDAWDAAWDAARSACELGRPAPVVDRWDC